MKVIDIINNNKEETLFSFEVLPPKKGEDIKHLYNCISPLMDFDPAFIDVTYHREEYVEKTMPNGDIKLVTTRKRPGTVGICAAIIHKYKVDVVPHLICGGFSRDETENALIDLNFLGIDNVLALQGDKLKTEDNFIEAEEGNKYASDLVEQIMNLNKGIYLDEVLENTAKTDFSVSVAGYPEKHYAARSMEDDLKYLKQKVDLGADYVVTQMFFDNQKYFDFVDRCREMGINVPIIPGLKPLSTKRQVEILPDVFFIGMPEDLRNAVKACKNNDAVKEIGIEWAIQQSKELKKRGVPVLHYYTMSKAIATQEIAKAVF